jgi:hypothetical protein
VLRIWRPKDKNLSFKWLSRYETTDVDAKRLAVSEARRSLGYTRFTKDVRVVTAHDFSDRFLEPIRKVGLGDLEPQM